jgi:hypothetical protein
MRKPAYADVAAKAQQLDTRCHILEIAATELPAAKYRHHDGRDTYTWSAFRLDGSAGGYVVCIYHGFINTHKNVSYVERLDVAIEHAQMRSDIFTDGMREAISRFQTARYELTNAN